MPNNKIKTASKVQNKVVNSSAHKEGPFAHCKIHFQAKLIILISIY